MKKIIFKAAEIKNYFDYFFYLALLFYIFTAYFSHKLNYRPFGDRDIPSYLFEWKSLAYVLSQHRTFGLPFFLQLFVSNNIDFNLWPYFQFSLMIISILYLRYCFKVVLKNNFLILLLSCLFLLMTFQERYNIIMSEPIGFAFLNFSLGAFLLSIIRRKKIDFFSLALFTFFCYQIRPAFIILPIALLFCSLYLFIIKKIRRSHIIYISLSLLCPIIFFMSLRFFLVNQFSLVAFTGTSISGHALMYLNDETIRKLPEKNKSFAVNILEVKKKLTPQMTGGFDCRALLENSKFDLSVILERYNQEYNCWNFLGMTAWVTAINNIKGTWPLSDAKRNIDPWNHVYTLSSYFSGDNVDTDKYLTSNSLEIIKVEYSSYLNWIFISCLYAPLAYLISSSRFYLTCFLLIFLWLLSVICKKQRIFFKVCKNDEMIIKNIFFVFSSFYFLLSLVPIIFIAAPLPRYLFAVFYFLYPALISWAFLKFFMSKEHDS